MLSTEKNQNNSPLLRLPAELRIRVYKYAFFGYLKIYEDNATGQRTSTKSSKQLLGTYRQIRIEATPMLYAVSTFYYKRVSHIRKLASTARAHVRTIRSVRLPVSLLHRHTFNGMKVFLRDDLALIKSLEELRFRGKPRQGVFREAMDRELFVSGREIRVIFEDEPLERW
jgi:hypothetical protein